MFRRELGASTTIVDDKRGCSSIAIRSNELSTDLAKFGVVPRKTTSAYLPPVPAQYIRHLLRGILDGDGCIQSHLMHSGKHRHEIGFCGTPQLMHDIKTHLEATLCLSERKIYTYSSTFAQVCWNRIQDLHAIGTYLYDDATVYLSRKYDLLQDFLHHYNLPYGDSEVTGSLKGCPHRNA